MTKITMALVMSMTLAMAAACGGSGATNSGNLNNGGNNNGNGNGNTGDTTPACSVTLSGGLAGSYDCGASAKAAWTSGEDKSGFFLAFGSGTNTSMVVGIAFAGQPRTGSYRFSDAASEGGVAVTSGGKSFIVSRSEEGDRTQGDYTLTFTKVEQVITATDGRGYAVHGTLDATVPALQGSGNGTVTLHAKF